MQDEYQNHYIYVFLMACLGCFVQSWWRSWALAKRFRIHTALFQHNNLTIPGAPAIPGGYVFWVSQHISIAISWPVVFVLEWRAQEVLTTPAGGGGGRGGTQHSVSFYLEARSRSGLSSQVEQTLLSPPLLLLAVFWWKPFCAAAQPSRFVTGCYFAVVVNGIKMCPVVHVHAVPWHRKLNGNRPEVGRTGKFAS